jgi:hypothetical protein
MEICRMDKPSHYYSGASSHQMYDSYGNFNEIDPNASSNFSYDKPQSDYQGYHSSRVESNWNNETVECKQEIDQQSFMGENSSYCSETHFNEPYQYPFNQMPASYTNDASTAKNLQPQPSTSYQISSQKNPLPSWYNPTQPSRPFFPQPNAFHQYPYQTDFSGAPSTPNVEQNMRNMIHLTSRYLSFFLSLTIFDEAINFENWRRKNSD